MPDPIKNPLPPKCIVLLCFVLLLFSSCLTQEQRKQKASEYINKGFKADEQGNYQEAIIYYNEALNLDSTNPVIYLNIAIAKMMMNNSVEAIADLKKSFALDTTWEIPLYGLGIIYYNQNKINDVINIYHQALSINPNSLLIYIALSETYLDLKNYDSALYYSKIISIKYPLAKEQKKKDYYIAPLHISNEAILSRSYFYEGLCYKYLGDIEQSKNYLSLAVQGGVAEAQDSLNTLLK